MLFVLFPLEKKLSFIEDTNAPNSVLKFLLCACCPSLKCLPLSSTVKQHTYSLPESELQGFKESFLTVSSEKIANSRNNFHRESQPTSVTKHCTLHQSLVSIRLFWSLLSRFQQTAHRKPQNKTQTILKQNTHLLETIWELPWIRYSKLQNFEISWNEHFSGFQSFPFKQNLPNKQTNNRALVSC